MIHAGVVTLQWKPCNVINGYHGYVISRLIWSHMFFDNFVHFFGFFKFSWSLWTTMFAIRTSDHRLKQSFYLQFCDFSFVYFMFLLFKWMQLKMTSLASNLSLLYGFLFLYANLLYRRPSLFEFLIFSRTRKQGQTANNKGKHSSSLIQT